MGKNFKAFINPLMNFENFLIPCISVAKIKGIYKHKKIKVDFILPKTKYHNHIGQKSTYIKTYSSSSSYH